MERSNYVDMEYHAEKELRSSHRKRVTPRQCMEYLVCLLVALPSATLNGVAALASGHDNLGDVHSPSELMHFIHRHATFPHNIYAFSVFALSSMVFFFLNQRYLFPSLYSSAHLIRDICKIAGNKISCARYFPLSKAPSAFHVFLFIWSFLTSLVFAEFGGKAFSFLGEPGVIVGFLLSLLVYFSTRYSSAVFAWDNFKNAHASAKNTYLNKLLLYPRSAMPAPVLLDGDSNVSVALRKWLKPMATGEFLPHPLRCIVFRYLVPLLSWVLVSASALPIMFGFIPDSIQGMERLFQIDLNQNSFYQNELCIVFGLLATCMTMLFYEINIKSLPKEFFITLFTISDHLQSKNYGLALRQGGLTFMAFIASYVTSIGFKFAVDSALSQGYFSYMGDSLGAVLPTCVLAAVMMMLWSHLQELINHHTQGADIGDLSNVTEVNAKNVIALLKHPSINFQPGLKSRSTSGYSLFSSTHNIDNTDTDLGSMPTPPHV